MRLELPHLRPLSGSVTLLLSRTSRAWRMVDETRAGWRMGARDTRATPSANACSSPAAASTHNRVLPVLRDRSG